MRVVKPQTPGECMKACRIRAGLSVAELSELSAVDAVTIYAWESDRYAPRLSSMILVVDALGISIDEYVGHVVREADI